MLALAWGDFFWRRRRPVCDRGGACLAAAGSARTTILLGLGSVVVGLAFVWGAYVEPILLKLTR
ncbi:hypothetical protein [Bosea sp. BIWAKO-01]|uniref:hypothetical protein n=1 Tax=Bosea sp. BIWAKO-01 TaxID=506668 RepID=UPI00086C9C09|nr:hypothetical protein [Bosea sp. BIWAKO-01]GAU84729.1 hypothetical protein BIWAKO_04666 [Bosea sp. BIWAKO-01]